VRREFFAPESLSGDVMITAPDRYQYYHKRTNVLDVAFWPSEQTERPQQLLKRIAGGGLQVERLGEESIAGRTAIILLVSPRNPNPNAHSVKLWLDSEAGILLKMETSNRNGLISRTYFTTITVGESANVRPRLFEPPSERNTVLNPLLPPQPTFPTLEAAQGKLPFVPLIPTNLPKGYQVTGVWAVQPERIGGRRPALILRYSDGAGTFTLFERLLPPPLQPINPDKKPIRRHKGMVHWVVPNPDGTLTALTFIGHLPPEQVEALRSSLR
jgi:negative regulator of sigma E activity